MAITLDNILSQGGGCNPNENASNAGGLVGELYLTLKCDVDSIPYPADYYTDNVIVSDIVMVTGKVFKRWDFKKGTANMDIALEGEPGSKSFKTVIRAEFSKINAEKLRQLANVANAELILVVKDANGQLWVVGSLDIPAEFDTGEVKTGVKTADKNFVAVQFMATAAHPPYEYQGAIPLV